MFSHALATIALASAASGLMVPPNLPNFPITMPPDPLSIPKPQPPSPARGQPRATVELACPSCPLAVGQIHGHPVKWAEGPSTRLLIELTSDGSQLYFNQAPIYPLAPSSLGRRLAAKQVYMDASDPLAVEELYSRPLPLSTGIEVHESVEMISFHLDASSIQDIIEKVPMRSLDIEIMGLGEELIKVDTIRVKFSDDRLEIHDVEILPYGSNDSDAEKECATVLCRLRADLEAKLAQLREKVGPAAQQTPKKPCAKHLQQQQQQQQQQQAVDGDMPSQPAGMPLAASVQAALRKGDAMVTGSKGHKSQHGLAGFRGGMDAKYAAQHHRHHHHHPADGLHGFVHTMFSFVYHVVLPVSVGIAAGMLVSAIGMVIGQALVWICGKIWGVRGEQEYEEVDADVDVNVDVDVDVVFVEVEVRDQHEEEFLPRYEDVEPGTPPPAFEEKEGDRYK